jgi:hypothetical protein
MFFDHLHQFLMRMVETRTLLGDWKLPWNGGEGNEPELLGSCMIGEERKALKCVDTQKNVGCQSKKDSRRGMS